MQTQLGLDQKWGVFSISEVHLALKLKSAPLRLNSWFSKNHGFWKNNGALYMHLKRPLWIWLFKALPIQKVCYLAFHWKKNQIQNFSRKNFRTIWNLPSKLKISIFWQNFLKFLKMFIFCKKFAKKKTVPVDAKTRPKSLADGSRRPKKYVRGA